MVTFMLHEFYLKRKNYLAYLPMDRGKDAGVGCHALFQGIFTYTHTVKCKSRTDPYTRMGVHLVSRTETWEEVSEPSLAINQSACGNLGEEARPGAPLPGRRNHTGADVSTATQALRGPRELWGLD